MYNNVNPSLNTVSFTKQRNRWLPHNFPLHNYRTMQIQKQQRSTCGLKYFHKYLAHSSDFSAKFPAINKGLLSAFLPSDKLAPHFQWVIQQREWYHLCKHTWSKSTIFSSAPPPPPLPCKNMGLCTSGCSITQWLAKPRQHSRLGMPSTMAQWPAAERLVNQLKHTTC